MTRWTASARGALALAVLLSTGACEQQRATPPNAPASSSDANPVAPVIPATAEASVPDAGGDGRCDALAAEVGALLASAPRTCGVDADCAAYQGGVNTGCGGVADRATVEKMSPLIAEFLQRKCRYTVLCAARAAGRPACERGKCIERP